MYTEAIETLQDLYKIYPDLRLIVVKRDNINIVYNVGSSSVSKSVKTPLEMLKFLEQNLEAKN